MKLWVNPFTDNERRYSGYHVFMAITFGVVVGTAFGICLARVML